MSSAVLRRLVEFASLSSVTTVCREGNMKHKTLSLNTRQQIMNILIPIKMILHSYDTSIIGSKDDNIPYIDDNVSEFTLEDVGTEQKQESAKKDEKVRPGPV